MSNLKRGSGVLLHITSLPSLYGVGDLGKSAYEFCNFLVETDQSYWQVLPLNPTLPVFGNSPYSSNSAFAGNPLLISPDLLVEDGYLSNRCLQCGADLPSGKVDYGQSLSLKLKILDKAFRNVKKNLHNNDQFNDFCSENSHWLDNYSYYCSLKEYFGDHGWIDFPEEIKDKKEPGFSDFKSELSDSILKNMFCQFLFFRQWNLLKQYCNNNGVKIVGDLPFYVNHDSEDVWSNRNYFKLDNDGNPLFVSGVPPDYFSETGQRWGNPVYNWARLKENNYEWWTRRIEHNLNLFDILRLDHFRGFASYWEIPVEEKNAVNGRWADVPSEDFFEMLLSRFTPERFIAEDLGEITSDVVELRDKYNFPGMNVLQFAFGDDYPNGSFLPENNREHSIIYTGTHDNNTTLGWWNKEATAEQRRRVTEYIGESEDFDGSDINWKFIELALGSRARISIIPLQDILGLGDESKMNKPSLSDGNWQWRFEYSLIVDKLKKRLCSLTGKYSRKK